jgi:hypothetical protein
VKLAIFDTEGLGEAIDDYAEATGSDPVVYGAAWAKSKGLAHGSPDALIAALKEAEKDPDVFCVLIDSATDVAHWGRVQYAAANPGKKIDYGKADAPVAKLEAVMKAFTKHWIATYREKDDKDTVDGIEVTAGKKAKAAGNLDYLARVKCHCHKTRTKDGVAIACDLTDQRGLGDKPSVRLVKPTSNDFATTLTLARYASNDRKLHAHFYGREGTGKSGCAMRLCMALQRVLQSNEGAE